MNTISTAVTAAQNIKQRDYWLNKLSGQIEKNHFPYETHKSNQPLSLKKDLKEWIHKFSPGLSSRIVKMSNGSDSRLFMILTAGLTALIYKYTGDRDVILGTSIYKQDVEVELINRVLALRNHVDGDMTFKELLLQVKETHIEAIENQDYPFETLVHKLNIPAAEGEFSLFETVLLLGNIHDRSYIASTHPSLLFYFTREDETLECRLEYDSRRYAAESVKRIGLHIENLLEQALLGVETRVRCLEILSKQERQQVLYGFNVNATQADSPAVKPISCLITEAAAKKPFQIVMDYEEHQLTFNALVQQVDRLAAGLRKKAVIPGIAVALVLDKSLDMVITLLGVLKAGAAYLPILPGYPPERINYMARDSRPQILLTQAKYVERLAEILGPMGPGCPEIIDVETFAFSRTGNKTDHLACINRVTDPAYVIYTSGTTGNPRGVLVEHGNVVNTITWFGKHYCLQPGMHVLQLSDYTFDPSVEQILSPLAYGASVYVAPAVELGGAGPFARYIEQKQIYMINFVPTILKQLLCHHGAQKLKSLQIVISGGERLDDNLKNEILEKGYVLYNQYGPTEITIDALVTMCGLEKPVVLGRPIANCSVYVLGGDNEPMPTGVPGELCISSPGVTRGYLNRPELTAEKFIPNPFEKGKRLYRSGDIVKWLADGNIEFIGRLDRQIKIRGHRIECEEIENQLLTHFQVKDAIVRVNEDNSKNKYLIAYYVSKDETTVDGLNKSNGLTPNDLRKYLQEKLPAYMIPSYFVSLERIPLTPNGKIDWKNLPELPIEQDDAYSLPRNEKEKKIIQIWADILEIEKNTIGIDANFFRLGGHSLNATILINRMHQELGVKLPLGIIFANPTVRSLAEYIKSSIENQFISIEPAPVKPYYPLSSAQKRLYILQQLQPESTEYNLPVFVLKINGDLEIPGLEGAFRHLIQRHESFRTSFLVVNDQPMQQIADELDFKIDYYTMPEAEAKSFIHNYIRPFDLSNAPLLRVGLVEIAAKQYILIIDMHHIITDAISAQIFIKDLLAFYAGETLPKIPITYKDFSEWHHRLLLSGEIAKQEIYWLNEFSGQIPMLNLPLDYERPNVRSFAGDTLSFIVNKTDTHSLNQIAQITDATLYMVLFAIFNVFLHKLGGQEDIIVGADHAGRRHADLEPVIGMFVNSFAMRNYPAPHKTFREFLEEVKDRTIAVFDNQDYQFELLVEKVVTKRNPGRNPLFDVMFSYHNIVKAKVADFDEKITAGLTFSRYGFDYKVSKFDLMLHGEEIDESLYFHFEYSTRLFKKSTIERFILYFKEIINQLLANSFEGLNKKLAAIELLYPEERKQILENFNGPVIDLPQGETVVHLFAKQVEKTPDHIAFIHGEKQVSCRQLAERSNQWAYLLKAKGFQLENIVGIMMDRSLEMAMIILGTWKAGGAYLPIDPAYPEDRIQYLLKDSGAKLLAVAIELQGEKVLLESIINHSSHLAYVIYTSGTTGNPKGAMVEHGGMLNHMQAKIHDLQLSHNSIIVQNASHTFDISVWQFFAALLAGGKTIIYSNELILEPPKLVSRLIQDKVTVLEVVPSYLAVMLEHLPHLDFRFYLEYLVITGETLKPQLVEKWFKIYPGIPLVNAYGPTEASDDITHHIMTAPGNDPNIPIGKPVQNFTIYIIDSVMNLCPIGVTGEIWVSGAGVGRGYLNRPELTAEKFIKNNRSYRSNRTNIFYKTGDLARWLPDGVIEFLGRKDQQVKIRGFRIELGEIENRLMQYTDIKEAVVIDKAAESGEKYLCAYYVLKKESNPEIPAVELQDYLSAILPHYMVPAYFIKLTKIPLTANGKINIKELPDPEILNHDLTGSKTRYTPPQTQLENICADVWSDVLGIERERIGIDDNFFQSGGHSLKAVAFLSKLHRELEVKIPLVTLFNLPTIRQLAEYIGNVSKTSKARYISIEPVEKKEYFPASSAQKRLYALHQMDEMSTRFNIRLSIPLVGNIDKRKIGDVINRLVARHEALRTSFETINNEMVQRIYPASYLLAGCDQIFTVQTFSNRDEMVNAPGQADQPFDLHKPPLIRVTLIIIGQEEHLLLVDIHHVISDGVSVEILKKEFTSLYTGKDLVPLKLQYKDFSEWQNRLFQSGAIKNQEEYWLERFKGDIPVLNMPLDYPRPLLYTADGNFLHCTIKSELYREIMRLIPATGATLYMILIAAYMILLAKYARQEDIIVGSPIAGRRHPDLNNIIGLFVNMLPMRSRPQDGKTFRNFLADVKKDALDAYENQDFPFDELARNLKLKVEAGRNPLFDAVFVLQNTDTEGQRTVYEKERPGPVEISSDHAPGKIHHELLLRVEDIGGTLSLDLEYAFQLYRESTARKLLGHYVEILEQITGNSDIKLGDITLSYELIAAGYESAAEGTIDFRF
ncbi:MAG TPA: amino acid adenylation domain-containing protein [Candidatus Deferrimicrobium sp.]|nr:amino acid adenylation domain-containing protein [Candidatus Deferrimicrobium sp.]